MDTEARLRLHELAEGKALPAGTKRKWGGKEYQKQHDGTWKPAAGGKTGGKATTGTRERNAAATNHWQQVRDAEAKAAAQDVKPVQKNKPPHISTVTPAAVKAAAAPGGSMHGDTLALDAAKTLARKAAASGTKPQDVKPSEKNKPDQTNVDNWVRDVFLGMKGVVSQQELNAAIWSHGEVHGHEKIFAALQDLLKEKYIRKTKTGYEWPDQVALARQPGFENEAVEKKTYAQAQQEILDYLSGKNWKVKTGLKIPHATSPDGSYRLWFKAQAVYFTDLKDPDRTEYGQSTSRHDYGDARTISYDLDIRTMTGEGFLSLVTKRLTKEGKQVTEQKRLMGFGMDRPSRGLAEAGLSPKTADDWQLYDMPGAEDAAEELTKALAVAMGVLKADLKAAKSNDKKALAKLIGKVYKKYLDPLMDKHTELGATDTEPLAVASQALIDVVKSHFGWSNYYMPELGDWM